MRRIGLNTLLGLLWALSAGPTLGDTLLVNAVNAAPNVPRPARGMTMEAVQQRFGAPSVRSAAVGNPPITSWDYGDFVVYFENQYVIHSVMAHKK